MPFNRPPARRVAAQLATAITAALLASASYAQSVQLLKDLKPGMVPDDGRQTVQVVATSETVYMVTQKFSTYDSSLVLNSTNGIDANPYPGFDMGKVNYSESVLYNQKYPLFAIKDGKAVFSNAKWEHCFFEFDGLTKTSRQLTSEPSYERPVAIWIGADGKVCFFRRSMLHWSNYEIGCLDSESSTGLRVTRTLPFSNENYGSYPGEAQVIGDRLIISIFENDHERLSVWSTDGSYDGTEKLLDFGSPDGITAHSILSGIGKCFISAGDNQGNLRMLYVTDGISSGTSILDSDFNGLLPSGEVSMYTESSSTLYWRNGLWESAIYHTDGHTTGILPFDAEENYGLRYGTVTWLNDRLYISTESDYGSPSPGPWFISDGVTTPTQIRHSHIPFEAILAKAETTTGTFLYTGRPANPKSIYYVESDVEQAALVAQGNDGYGYNPHLVNFQGSPVYSQDDPTTNSEQLWTSNPADPYRPHQITRFTQIPADSNPGQFEVASNSVYFRNINATSLWDPEIFKTDGTAGGSGEISLHNPVWLGEVPGGMLFYDNTRDPFTGEVWSHSNVYFFNGTSFNYQRYIQPTMGEPPTEPARLFTIGDKCFFGGNYDHVPRLFASDGNLPGHSEISNFWETDLEAPLHPIGVSGNRGLFYARTTNTATITYEIWSTDGTDTGTTKIADSVTTPTVGAAVAGGKVVFGASLQSSENRLIVSDGTAEGTTLVEEVSTSYAPLEPRHFVSSGGKAFFIANFISWASPARSALWVADETPTGTVGARALISPIPEDEVFAIMGNNGGGLYLSGILLNSYRIIYSDGTSAGTRIVATLPLDAQPQLLGDVNGYMYIAMTTPELGRELYRTVGHTGGLELVEDFAPGPDSGAVMSDAAVFGNKLIFAANPHDGLTGTELHYIEVLDSNVDDWQIY